LSKVEQYFGILKKKSVLISYLLENSNLPGPRANLELANAVALKGKETLIKELASWSCEMAPSGTREEFLALCGVWGIGRLISEGKQEYIPILRKHASDQRWRIREAVAKALQLWGLKNRDDMIKEMYIWSQGKWLEKRAVVAGISESELLENSDFSDDAVQLLDIVTKTLFDSTDRKNQDLMTLKKALGYCWSVCVVANPGTGIAIMENWMDCDDSDIRWIMRENLKKKRLFRLLPEWTENYRKRVADK